MTGDLLRILCRAKVTWCHPGGHPRLNALQLFQTMDSITSSKTFFCNFGRKEKPWLNCWPNSYLYQCKGRSTIQVKIYYFSDSAHFRCAHFTIVFSIKRSRLELLHCRQVIGEQSRKFYRREKKNYLRFKMFFILF